MRISALRLRVSAGAEGEPSEIAGIGLSDPHQAFGEDETTVLHLDTSEQGSHRPGDTLNRHSDKATVSRTV